VALDTSWDQNVLTTGAVAVLQDPQAGYVAKVAGGNILRVMEQAEAVSQSMSKPGK